MPLIVKISCRSWKIPPLAMTLLLLSLKIIKLLPIVSLFPCRIVPFIKEGSKIPIGKDMDKIMLDVLIILVSLKKTFLMAKAPLLPKTRLFLATLFLEF